MTLSITYAHPPVIPGYHVRPAVIEDAEAIHAMMDVINLTDERGNRDNLDDRRRDFSDPDVNPATDTLVVFAPNGSLAATGWIFSPPPGNDASMSFLQWEVHPAHRGQGIEDALLPWLETRSRQIQAGRTTELPRVLRSMHQGLLQDRNQVMERHGYIHIRSNYRMRRDLNAPIPEPALPDGVALIAWDPARNLETIEVCNRAFQDHWGAIDFDETIWRMWLVDHPYFRPELTRLALANGQVVGFSMNQVREEEITAPWVQELGVLRGWRKRGIASALLCDSMRAFKAAGYDQAFLGVDAENLTGALRLYESLGFRVARSFRFYSKPAD
jgi:mycothiol synthase